MNQATTQMSFDSELASVRRGKASRGDAPLLRDALTDLYKRSRPQLVAVASRYVNDEAEDLVQEAFLGALRHEHEYRYEAAPSTWLHRIVVNACLSLRRNYRRRQQLCLIYLRPALTTNARAEQAVDIQTSLRLLSPAQYYVFMMYEVMGHTHREIASSLSIPLSTSKWRLTTARRKLKESLAATEFKKQAERTSSITSNGRTKIKKV